MSLAVVYSRAQLGISAPQVTVEVHLSNGLPGFSIVGLPEAAVRESKDRVRSALLNSHFEFPDRRITVNLAPAELPKQGGRYDLAIAVGILAASGQIPAEQLLTTELLGELALSGELRAVSAALPAALAATRQQRALLVPGENAAEAALAPESCILATDHLLKVCAHLNGRARLPHQQQACLSEAQHALDLSDLLGQQQARRALEIAACGGHHLLMSGPPGSGKTMLASRLPGILPPPSPAEQIELATILSVTTTAPDERQLHCLARSFRSPHHSASAVALAGGGNPPRPGEISLAHNGVLFLDELAEFPRRVLEVLREPLECGEIHISRAGRQLRFPARFQLITAMNPCPCGYHGDNSSKTRTCRCTPDQIQRYLAKISGPLVDRIDLQIQVPRLSLETLSEGRQQPENSATVRQRVINCRERQLQRQNKANHLLSAGDIDRYCVLAREDRRFLQNACEKLGLSARAYHRILKVARTLADMEDEDRLLRQHLSEALAYRHLERQQPVAVSQSL